MSLNLRQITQEFCRRQALPVPDTVIDAQNDSVLQIWGLLNEGQADLSDRYQWPGQIQQARSSGVPAGMNPPYFTHAGYGYNKLIAASLGEVTTEPGGGISAVSAECPMPGFKSVVRNTFWELTSRIPVYGPLMEEEWMYITTLGVKPTRFAWKFDTDYLYITPYSDTARFSLMYYSRFSVGTPDPTTHGKGTGIPPAVTNSPVSVAPTTNVTNPLVATSTMYGQDIDVSIIPDRIVLQDLKWRWRASKGLPYAEDQRALEAMVQNYISRAPAADVRLDPDTDAHIVGPGLYVVAGNTIPP